MLAALNLGRFGIKLQAPDDAVATRHAGRSFETLRTALPCDHCCELIYRRGAVGFG